MPKADTPRPFTSVPIAEQEANMLSDLREWHEFLAANRYKGQAGRAFREMCKVRWSPTSADLDRLCYSVVRDLDRITLEHRRRTAR